MIIEAEKDSEIFIIPPSVYQKLMNESLPVSKYTNDLMASRFSEVMWLMEQVMWKSFDKRLAAFLTEEAAIEGVLHGGTVVICNITISMVNNYVIDCFALDTHGFEAPQVVIGRSRTRSPGG